MYRNTSSFRPSYILTPWARPQCTRPVWRAAQCSCRCSNGLRFAARAVALRRSSAPGPALLAPRCSAPRLVAALRLPVSAPQVRRRCHSGRHGRRRVAGRSLSALISLRNGWRGERDVALRQAARCSAAVCLLLADCSPVALCHPQVGRPRRLQRGSETQGLLPRSFGSDRRATPDLGASVLPVCTWWVPMLGRAAHLTRVVSSFSWPVVLTTPLLVCF